MSKTVTEIMEPHREVLQDMIPPKKHLLRYQPANAQIGIMVGRHFDNFDDTERLTSLLK